MEWQFVVALVVVIPIILFPVAFLWYLNAGGIYAAIREARKRKVAQGGEGKVETEERFYARSWIK